MTSAGERRPIAVMVVDPSSVIRGLIGSMLEGDPQLRLVATAKTGSQALHLLQRHQVDVLLCDSEVPELRELLTLCRAPQLPASRPVQVIMLSGPSQSSAENTVLALSLGAGDFLYKPLALSKDATQALARDLQTKMRALAGIGPPAPPPKPSVLQRAPAPVNIPAQALAFGASTGGPQALTAVLKGLPAKAPPVLLVQHMPPLFTASFAAQLHRETGRPCHEGKDGEAVMPGRCYVAPGGQHMTVVREGARFLLRLSQGPEENFCRPSVDVLFRSVARCFGPAAVGVVLTGMGRDGVAGAEAIVRAGGHVLCQDLQSSVVWGMPGSVVQAGLCSAMVPLGEMAVAVSAYL